MDPANPNYSALSGVLFNKSQTTLIQFPGGKAGCYAIPNSVTSIGDGAFAFGTSLTSVTIPNNVTSIGNWAFYSCTNLSHASFTGNAPTLGADVFWDNASGFTVNYFDGATGFTEAPWTSYTLVNMGARTPVTSWLVEKAMPYNANLQDDSNGDGVSLLIAYALNLDPQQNLSASLPQPVIAADQMSLNFYAGNHDVTYTVETSNDLQHWTTQGVSVSGPDANQVRTATVEMTGTQRYLRLVAGH